MFTQSIFHTFSKHSNGKSVRVCKTSSHNGSSSSSDSSFSSIAEEDDNGESSSGESNSDLTKKSMTLRIPPCFLLVLPGGVSVRAQCMDSKR